MTLSKRSKAELVSEVKKLQKKLEALKKSKSPAGQKKTLTTSSNNDRWESLFKQSANLIILVDKKGCILDINRLEKGTKRENIIGKIVYSFVVPAEQKKIRAVINAVFKNGSPKEYITFRIDKKGARRNYKSRVTALIEKKKITAVVIEATDITNEKKSQDELQQSEFRFRTLAENATDLIYRCSVYPDLKYEYVSPSVKAITGYTAKEFYDNPFLGFQIVHPDDTPLLGGSEDLIKQKSKLSNVLTREITVRWIKKDGSVIWTETRTRPIFNKKKQLIAIEGISRDITRQKLSEEGLKESEERFKIISNATFEGIVFTENGKIIDANDQFVKMYGFSSAKEIKGKDLIEDFVVEDQKALAKKFLRLEKPKSYEVQTIDKLKNIITIESKGQNIPYFGRDIRATVIYNISDRKQYELELKRSRQNYKSLVDYSPDGIIIHIDGIIKFANPSALKIIGLDSFEEFKELTAFDFILPEYHQQTLERIQRARAGESLDFTEIKIRNKTGEIVVLETKPILINYNGVEAFQVVFHDITSQKQLIKQQLRAQLAEESNEKLQQEIAERKNAERVLQETQKYTRLLIDSSLDMICASDKEGFITEFNAAAQTTFGYELDEVIGKHVSILYAKPEERIRITNEELYGKGRYAGEVVNLKKSGEPFIAYLSASVLKDDEGQVLGAMGVSRDISELKRAEEEIKLSEEKYKAIYDQAYIGIARVGLKEGDFIEVNQRLCNILGYSSDELCKMTTWQITHPDDLITNVPERKEFLKSGSDILSTEKRYLHKDGSVVYANLTITLVKDATGVPQYFVSVYEDITERKKAEVKLYAQSAKLNAVFESSSHIIWTLDRNFQVTSFNKMVRKRKPVSS